MEKKIYVKRYPREDGRREEGRHEHRRHRRDEYRGERPRPHRPERPERPERPRHEKHMHWDFVDHKPGKGRRSFDDERHFRRIKKHMGKQITKMFTDKLVMVDYVNAEGEKGHNIDVYKIEDDLYKVVVTKKPNFEKLFDKVIEEEEVLEEAEEAEEVEIEVEIEEE